METCHSRRSQRRLGSAHHTVVEGLDSFGAPVSTVEGGKRAPILRPGRFPLVRVRVADTQSYQSRPSDVGASVSRSVACRSGVGVAMIPERGGVLSLTPICALPLSLVTQSAYGLSQP